MWLILLVNTYYSAYFTVYTAYTAYTAHTAYTAPNTSTVYSASWISEQKEGGHPWDVRLLWLLDTWGAHKTRQDKLPF